MKYDYKKVTDLNNSELIRQFDKILVSQQINDYDLYESVNVDISTLNLQQYHFVKQEISNDINHILSSGEGNIVVRISNDFYILKDKIDSDYAISNDIDVVLRNRNLHFLDDKTNFICKLDIKDANGNNNTLTQLTSISLQEINKKTTEFNADKNPSFEPMSASTIVPNSWELYESIYSKFMDGTSKTNQLANKDFVNSSINAIASYYITKIRNPFSETSSTTQFYSYHDLSSSSLSDLYSGNVHRNPTRNDYCIVLSDETVIDSEYNISCPTTRYSYQPNTDESPYDSSFWKMQYVVNSTAFTDAQWKAVNSGVTKEKIDSLTSNTQYASDTNYGVVKIGNGIGVVNGLISAEINKQNITQYLSEKTVFEINKEEKNISVCYGNSSTISSETWTFVTEDDISVDYDILFCGKRRW